MLDNKKNFYTNFRVCKSVERTWFNDNDLRRLENELLQNPKVGKVIRGTGRLRKMRFAFEGRGKSGSTRVCYVDFEIKETIFLLAVFAKNEIENLSMEERLKLKHQIDILEDNL